MKSYPSLSIFLEYNLTDSGDDGERTLVADLHAPVGDQSHGIGSVSADSLTTEPLDGRTAKSKKFSGMDEKSSAKIICAIYSAKKNVICDL